MPTLLPLDLLAVLLEKNWVAALQSPKWNPMFTLDVPLAAPTLMIAHLTLSPVRLGGDQKHAEPGSAGIYGLEFWVASSI